MNAQEKHERRLDEMESQHKEMKQQLKSDWQDANEEQYKGYTISIGYSKSVDVSLGVHHERNFGYMGLSNHLTPIETHTMNTYEKPTYRQYHNNADQWQEWKRQAHALGLDEAKRHASVSTNNNHRCHECFCCAAREYVAEQLRKPTEA